MIRSLSSVVKDIIKQQSTQVDVVQNLYGAPIVFEREDTTLPTEGTWRIFEINTLDLYSPDDIISKVSSILFRTAPIIVANEGVVGVTTAPGTTMLSTVVSLSQAVGFNIQMYCAGKQIALYVGENLVRRGTNSLITTINLPAGRTPISVITYGAGTADLTIQIPGDIPISIGAFIPPVPRLLDSGAINTNYVDPRTGATGITISWYNQENVGGWGAYAVKTTPFGTIGSILSVGGKYIVVTNFSGTGPFDSSVAEVGNIVLGTVESSTYNDERTSLVLTINAAQRGEIDLALIHSGILNILTFQNLQNILRASQSDTITFVDTNVSKGTSYTYCIDSYAPADAGLRSSKTPFITLVAGDIFPPGNITLHSVKESGGRLNAAYTPPSDADYLATRIIHYYMGSGTGQIDNTRVITDFGFPSIKDSVLFEAIGSGTYYFVTTDQVGNQQFVLSGVPYYYTGVISSPGVNLAPTVRISQLSSAEMVVDPRQFAQFKLEAIDPEASPSTVVQYIIQSGTGATWQIAPTNPYTVTIPISNRDAWVRVRAFDGTLYSDELMFVADYDSTPELVSIYSRYMIASGATFVNGSVDDDTKSIKWFINEGAEPGDPTPASPALIDNLNSLKTFSFSFPQPDGSRKVLKINPYPDLGGNGTVGQSYDEEFIRLPRTRASVSDRTPSGSVSKTNVFITLSSSPDTAVIFDRVSPIDYGTVTSGTAYTLTDNTQTWTLDLYNNGYEVKIVAGVGEGQVRSIQQTQQKTLVIVSGTSLPWSVIPDSSSKYYIREKFRHYSDNGKATGATNNTLIDNTKSWYSNEFATKDIFIYSGTGVGQLRTITSNGATQVTVTPNWTLNPTSTSGYKIFGPIKIARDVIEDTTVDFYSTVIANGLTEEIQSITIDSDDVPEIGSATITEPSNNKLNVTISGIDEDTKYWSAWVRRNNWPTILSGVATASLDDDYMRANQESIDSTQIQFDATTGFWYGIVVPYDSYNNPGPRVIFSGSITGTITVPPAIFTSINAEPNDQTSSYQLNRIWWNHNTSAEKPGAGNGVITIKLFAYRSDQGSGSEIEYTNPATRYSWQDSEDNSAYANTDDTLNSRVARGSVLHRVKRGTAGVDPFLTWYYKVRLISGATTLADYNTTHSDFYTTSPIGTSYTDSTWTPTSDSWSTSTAGIGSGTSAPINILTGGFPAKDNQYTITCSLSADASGMSTGAGGAYDVRTTVKLYYSDDAAVNWTFLTSKYVQVSKTGVNQSGGTASSSETVTVSAGTAASQMRFKAELNYTLTKLGNATGTGAGSIGPGNVTWFVEDPLP